MADPRNFDLVLQTFETDTDRDNVCHRLNVPFVKSTEVTAYGQRVQPSSQSTCS